MKRSKIAGIIGTISVHAILVLFLILYTLSVPKPEEEGGVPVMLGNTEIAQGDSDPYTLTEVDMLEQPEPEAVQPTPEPEVEKPLITQQDEPSVKVKEEKPKKKEEPKKEAVKKEKKQQPKPKEKTEAEKRAEAAQAAASKIAGAFGKGSKMGSKGEASSGSGFQGTPTGNSATGKTTGVGGTGTFDLNGRSLGPGGLPAPIYNVQDEGRVVVTIVVNPQGQVVNASINKRTNTVNPSLRKAAMDAAKKARFNTVSGVENQSGTITYYFKLK